jgi:ferredoxin
MTVQLIVDPDVCIGSGECVATDPEAIELDDTGCARVLIAQLEESRATELCDVCPVGALSIRR